MKGIFLVLLLALSSVLNGLGACYCIGQPPEPVEALAYDVVIVDPDETPPGTVEFLHGQGRTVLAYINAGYAEDWRWYWGQAVAAGIVHGQTEYEGEYFVEYWSGAWLEIILEYVSTVLEAGYDGVYLDNIDASLILSEERPAWTDGVDLNESMIDLVEAVSRISPLVYVNIGSAIHLLYEPRFLESIDGVLREEVFRWIEGPGALSPVPAEESRSVLEALIHARDAGVHVMVVEFVHTSIDAAVFYLYYQSLGITPILQPDIDPDYMRPPLRPG